MKNKIARLEDKLAVLREELKITKDPDTHAELGEKIDFIQDEIDELEEDNWDAEDVYGVLGHADSPSLDQNLNA